MDLLVSKLNNTTLNHFSEQIIALTSTFPNTGKDRETTFATNLMIQVNYRSSISRINDQLFRPTMSFCNIVDRFHD